MRKPFIIVSATPCMHCGSPRNSMSCRGIARSDGSPVRLVYQVMCVKCRAAGPLAQTAREAVAGWEHRATSLLDELEPEGLPEVEFEEAG